MIEIEVLFFGALKQYFPRELRVKLNMPATPESLKSELAASLSSNSDAVLALLNECAVATESEIIPKGQVLPVGKKVALLPPVCGG